MTKAKVYNQEGKEAKTLDLPDKLFGLPWNPDLVQQVVVSMQSNKRAGTAHTKDRSEIRGGGKKPWRQKGTGRARHGSIRSPIWRGGGITFGPRKDKNYSKKINRKMKRTALFTVLSKKVREGEIIFLDSLDTSSGKTRTAASVLDNLSKTKDLEKISYKSGKRAIIYNSKKDDNFVRMFRNLPAVGTEEVRNANALDVITYKYIVFVNPEATLKELVKTDKEKTL